MPIEKYVGKLVSISAEARQRSTADMWRVRDQQPLAQRIGKTALGFILHSESIRNKAVKRVAKFVGGDSVLGHGVEQVVVASGNDAVVKLLIHTISQDRLEVETKAKQLVEQAGVCKEYLADYWLNTQFEPVDLGIIDRLSWHGNSVSLIPSYFRQQKTSKSDTIPMILPVEP